MTARRRIDQDDDHFIDGVATDFAYRERRLRGWIRREEHEGAAQSKIEAVRDEIIERGCALGRGTETGADESTPPRVTDVTRWLDEITDLACCWRWYYPFAWCAPAVNAPQLAFDASRRLFQMAIRKNDRSALAAFAGKAVEEFSKLGDTVPINDARGLEGAQGLTEYFKLLAHGFSRFDGVLPARFDLDLRKFGGPGRAIEVQRPTIVNVWLDRPAMRLRNWQRDSEEDGPEGGAGRFEIALKSFVRVNFLEVLAGCHGWMSGARLKKVGRMSAPDNVKRTLVTRFGFDWLVESSRDGYALRPGIRVHIEP